MDTNREIITHTPCKGEGCEGCNYRGRVFMNGDKLRHKNMTIGEALSIMAQLAVQAYEPEEMHFQLKELLHFLQSQANRIERLKGIITLSQRRRQDYFDKLIRARKEINELKSTYRLPEIFMNSIMSYPCVTFQQEPELSADPQDCYVDDDTGEGTGFRFTLLPDNSWKLEGGA